MNYPFAPRLDSRFEATGVYNAGTGKTRWDALVIDSTIDAVVLGDDFGSLAGMVLTPTTLGGAFFVVTGRWDAGPCILGRLFGMSVELSRPFRRRPDGVAMIGDRLQIQMVHANHRNTGAYSLRASMPNRTDRTRTMSPAGGALLEEYGVLRAPIGGDTKTMQMFIENNTAKPSTVTAVTYLADAGPGMGR